MARLAGVDLPRNKRMEIALTYIYGIGPSRSKELLEKTGISPDLRTDNLMMISCRRFVTLLKAPGR